MFPYFILLNISEVTKTTLKHVEHFLPGVGGHVGLARGGLWGAFYFLFLTVWGDPVTRLPKIIIDPLYPLGKFKLLLTPALHSPGGDRRVAGTLCCPAQTETNHFRKRYSRAQWTCSCFRGQARHPPATADTFDIALHPPSPLACTAWR